MATKKHILAFNKEKGLPPDTVTQLGDFVVREDATDPRTSQPLPEIQEFRFVPDGQAYSGRVAKQPAAGTVDPRKEADKMRRATDRVEWLNRVKARRQRKLAEERAAAEARKAVPITKEDSAEDVAPVIATKRISRTPRQHSDEEKSTRTTAKGLSADEIAAHEKAEAERKATQDATECRAHNERADAIRAALIRREKHIIALEALLATSTADRQSTIDEKRGELARAIVAHEAQHTPSDEKMGETERSQHNVDAENMRRGITRQLAHVTALKDALDPSNVRQQQEVRSEEGRLAASRRALAEHIAHTIKSDRLLRELKSRSETHIRSLETALARNISDKQHEISLQRQKLAETRRELAEHISAAVKDERLIGNLNKRIADQAARVNDFSRAGFDTKKTQAEAQLSRLQRQLKGLLEKTSHGKSPDGINEATPATKPVSIKPKESKRDRLWREALEAEDAAKNARRDATDAQDSANPLHKLLDKRATHLETAAALKAEKFRKEDIRSNEPPAKKTAVKPKPKAKQEPSTPDLGQVEPLPADRPNGRKRVAAEAADAESTPATTTPVTAKSNKPAKQRIRYPKKIAAPLRPIPPELAEPAPSLPSDGAAPSASAMDSPIMAPTPDNPVPSAANNDLAQQVLAILNGADSSPAPIHTPPALVTPEPVSPARTAPAEKKLLPSRLSAETTPVFSPAGRAAGETPQPVVNSMQPAKKGPSTREDLAAAQERLIAFHRENRRRAEEGLPPLPAYEPHVAPPQAIEQDDAKTGKPDPKAEEALEALIARQRAQREAAAAIPDGAHAAEQARLTAERAEAERAKAIWRAAQARTGKGWSK